MAKPQSTRDFSVQSMGRRLTVHSAHPKLSGQYLESGSCEGRPAYVKNSRLVAVKMGMVMKKMIIIDDDVVDDDDDDDELLMSMWVLVLLAASLSMVAGLMLNMITNLGKSIIISDLTATSQQ